MIESKCKTCRNCFADCESAPTFISEDVAKEEGLSADTVIECDAYTSEEETMSDNTFEKENLCKDCYEDALTCGHNPDSVTGHCDYFYSEDDDDSEDDSYLEEDDDSEDNSEDDDF